MTFKIGDWVNLNGHIGYITKIDDLWGDDEREVNLLVREGNKWVDYMCFEDELISCHVYRDRGILLDLALGLRDFKWCEELAKEIKK